MHTLLRFGSGSRLYTFPTGYSGGQITYEDDFDKLNNQIIRLPGVNGGYRQLGSGRGRSIGGTVKADYWLKFDTVADASDKVISIRQMAEWGLMPLWRQPLSGAPQFCMAALNSEALRQDVHALPHVRQRIPLVFDVPDPFWYRTVSGFGKLWDDGTTLWDDGTSWEMDTSRALGGSATWTFTNPGNASTFPRMQLSNTSGSTAGDIRVQRIVDGVTEDEFYYTAALETGTYLDVDPVAKRVTVQPGNTNALDNFTAKNPDWMRLPPGTSTLKFTNSGGLLLFITYLERSI